MPNFSASGRIDWMYRIGSLNSSSVGWYVGASCKPNMRGRVRGVVLLVRFTVLRSSGPVQGGAMALRSSVAEPAIMSAWMDFSFRRITFVGWQRRLGNNFFTAGQKRESGEKGGWDVGNVIAPPPHTHSPQHHLSRFLFITFDLILSLVPFLTLFFIPHLLLPLSFYRNQTKPSDLIWTPLSLSYVHYPPTPLCRYFVFSLMNNEANDYHHYIEYKCT